MATPSQATANVANAQLSTGPRTAAGKTASSRNSLKHGLTSKTVLVPGEDPAEYQAFAEGMLADLGPLNTIEFALSQELIDLQWRLLRVSGLEARILSADRPDWKSLSNIGLHASRMKRQYSATVKEFLKLQAMSLRSREVAMEQAATLRRAGVIPQRPSGPDQFGFVFAPEEIDGWISEQDALEGARELVKRGRRGPA